MSLRQEIDNTLAAMRFAAAQGDHDTAAELRARSIELEHALDARPGDFADDCCGDPSMAPVPGLACS